MVPLEVANLIIERVDASIAIEAIEVVHHIELNELREVKAALAIIERVGVDGAQDRVYVLLPLAHLPSRAYVALCIPPTREKPDAKVQVNELSTGPVLEEA